jgi:hypothetical protein
MGASKRWRLTRWFAVLLVAACAATRIRSEAALALECSEFDVSIEEKKPGTWLAKGCDKSTLCSLGSGDGAEPACVKGIPNEQEQPKPAPAPAAQADAAPKPASKSAKH